ncbi:MAG TPA: hypothetical protein VGM05_16890 [Planctomycetaceae bacterium]
MTTKAMIEQMSTKGLWSSPKGKTSGAMLDSAINRKGEASRSAGGKGDARGGMSGMATEVADHCGSVTVNDGIGFAIS